VVPWRRTRTDRPRRPTLVPADGFAPGPTLCRARGRATIYARMRLVIGAGPVLRVNHGSVGFLGRVAPDQLQAALYRLAEGRFTLEPAQLPWTSAIGYVRVHDVPRSTTRGDALPSRGGR